MTNIQEILKRHGDLMEEAMQNGAKNEDNLDFCVHLKDGTVEVMLDKVCYGAIYSGAYNTAMTHVTVDFENCNTQRFTDRERTEWLKAVKRWLTIYEHVLPCSVETMMEQGVLVVDVHTINHDAMGALLVGFRNLSEQCYYRQFNIFVEADFKLHQAAMLAQWFREPHLVGAEYFERGNTGHNILRDSDFTNFSKNSLKTLLNSCNLFNSDFISTYEEAVEGEGLWGMAPHLNGEVTFETSLSEVATIKHTSWGGDYAVYPKEALINFFKELAE